ELCRERTHDDAGPAMRAGQGLFFYRARASPLHAARAGVAACWALALIAIAVSVSHPVVLAATLVAVLTAAAGSGVAGQLLRALRTASLVAVPIVLINVLVSRHGLTVFARLGSLGPFGQGDLTLEALVFGAVVALQVTLVILIATIASLAVDPDELLRIVRRLSFRSALTASLAVRMVPLLAADAQRLAEAQRTRPPGGVRGARARLAIIAAVLDGSLDRAMDVAATLEVRGFASARRAARLRRPWSRHDLAFACSALALAALAVAAPAGAPFNAYPTTHMPIGTATAVLCAAIIATVALPFCDRRGIDP
ncbi:MAG TPA: energy-coupling factor transporter transmembrane component T, partial [Solirubrobacteraceae bacterium]|nr:energy-coupling factor transporter transmembrane component T [Solirubrobacteraceae bacterium]